MATMTCFGNAYLVKQVIFVNVGIQEMIMQ